MKSDKEHGGDHGKIHDEPPGREFLNTKTEILDYESADCDLIKNHDVAGGLPFVNKLNRYKISGFILLGICSSVVALFILVVHEELIHYKLELLIDVFNHHGVISAEVASMWFACVLVPAMIGCLIVVFIEPKAAGGGVAGVVGFVNGVDTSATLTLKVLIVKTFSVICAITAGLAAGMEGPLVHIGAIVGASLPNFHIGNYEPLRYLRTDASRVDLVSGGIADGITAAFFAPIGGLVMSMEEGMMYWNLTLIFLILISALITQIIVTYVMSLVVSCTGCLSSKGFLFFSVLKKTQMKHHATFMLIYCVEAAFFGLSGAFWNMCQTKLILLRKKYVKKKWQQILELFAIASVTAAVGFGLLVLLRANCVKDPGHDAGFHYGALKMECPEGEITAIGTLLSHTQGNALRFLFYDSDSFDVITLLSFGIIYFFLSCVTMGAFIAGGIFIPNLLSGAVIGRLFGELLKRYVFYEDELFRPNILAIIGAACQLGGVIRIPFTLGVMMIESSGNTSFLFPIFITQIISTIVGNIFNHSIYHTQCFLGGQPIAVTEPPPFCYDIELKTLIKTQIVSFQKMTTVQEIFDKLQLTKHNMFPILNGKVLEGTILRYQLIKILTLDLYKGIDNLRIANKYYAFKDRNPLTIEKIKKEEFNLSDKVNLEPFMNKSPYTLLGESSLNNAYNLMAFVGARHIVVVNKQNEALGILTRKDVLFLREHSTIFGVHVVRLPRV